MRSRPSMPATRPEAASEILTRQVFVGVKALLMEPSALPVAGRHDNIEAIYRKPDGAA